MKFIQIMIPGGGGVEFDHNERLDFYIEVFIDKIFENLLLTNQLAIKAFTLCASISDRIFKFVQIMIYEVRMGPRRHKNLHSNIKRK